MLGRMSAGYGYRNAPLTPCALRSIFLRYACPPEAGILTVGGRFALCPMRLMVDAMLHALCAIRDVSLGRLQKN